MTTSTELVSVDAKINLDDVVSVRVAEVELQLDKRVNAQRELVKQRREKMDAASQKLAKVASEEAAAFIKANSAPLVAALKTFGVTVTVSPALHNIAVVSGGKIVGALDLMSQKSRSAVIQVTIPVTKRMKTVLDETTQAEKDFKDTNEGLLILMDGKAKVPVFERTCRAKVAENRLSKTAEGREILTKLRGEDVNSILSLPTGTI